MNIKVFSSLVKENISLTIFVGLYIGTEKERLVPILWDKEDCLFIRDTDKEIQYKGSNCSIDETNDNKLAEKLITEYLKSENACVCNL